jgi:hypothetical protein
MPKFIIVEERTETFSCEIEAEDLEEARKLYDQDPEEVFGDQWEHDETISAELRYIHELKKDGKIIDHVFENGKLQDSIERDGKE